METKRKDEAAKVAAGKKKYSVPFKRKVVQECLVGLKTPTAIFEEYGVRAGLLHQWHGWYHEHFVHKGNDVGKMKTKKTKTAVTVLELEQELARTRAQLFPNPSDGDLSLALDLEYIGEATFTLSDCTGRRLKTLTLSLDGGISSHKIDLEGMPAGIYMALVQAGATTWQQRLVLN